MFSPILRISRPLLTLAFWTVLALVALTLVLAACGGSAASTVVNNL